MLTSFALSMVVNILVTGLIVFKILKVFLELTDVTTSVERTLGPTGGTKLRHVIFMIIESGMILFAVQLAQFVLYNLPSESASGLYIVFIGINEMLNVIIRFKAARFLLIKFTTWIGYHTNNNFVACLDEIVL